PDSTPSNSRLPTHDVTLEVEVPPQSRAHLGLHKPSAPISRWIAATIAFLMLGGGAWWTFNSTKPPALIDGSIPSANREANDQYTLALNFLAFQNEIPLARKTFRRALELDPQFASARLQNAGTMIVEIFNGYANDESVLYQAEEELH